MLPVQFIFLLLMATLPAELAATGYYRGTGGRSDLLILAAASFLLTHLGLVFYVLTKTRREILLLSDPFASSASVILRNEALFNRARWATVAITAIHLFFTPLPATLLETLAATVILKHIPLIAECLFLTPAVVTWLMIWTAAYSLETAAHERSLPYRLARQLPVHEMPSLSSFLSMQARHQFFPFLFLVLHASITTLGALLTRWIPSADVVASVVGLMVLLLIVPWLLTTVWSTTPLLGPLRRRLDAVAAQYRLRFRDILLWRTHNLILNAAIIGWLPRIRFFLMSDTLLETFSDRQLEAVFAHEVGHGVHRHIPWYIAAFAGSVLLATGLTVLAVGVLSESVLSGAVGEYVLSEVLLITLLCFFGGMCLCLIAPRFEHQADWFAARHMATTYGKAPPAESAIAPCLMVPVESLPSELRWTLSTLPSAAETVSLRQYLAGQYPHAPAAGLPPTDSAAPFAGDAPARPPAPPHPPTHSAGLPRPVQVDAPGVAFALTPQQAGAEDFISALDAIVESTHRSRDRRGIMHPSINDRIALLRTLSTSPEALRDFNQLMTRTRITIVAILLAGIAASTAAVLITPDSSAPPPPTTQSQPIPMPR